jgi:hypothetical protein
MPKAILESDHQLPVATVAGSTSAAVPDGISQVRGLRPRLIDSLKRRNTTSAGNHRSSCPQSLLSSYHDVSDAGGWVGVTWRRPVVAGGGGSKSRVRLWLSQFS